MFCVIWFSKAFVALTRILSFALKSNFPIFMKTNIKKISITILAIILFVVLVAFAAQNLLGKDKKVDSSPNNSNPNKSSPNNSSNNSSTNSSVTSSKSNPEITEAASIKLLEANDQDIVFGDKNAPLTMVEYASLSCPHCATFYNDGFNKLKEEYIKTGKVKFIYRDFPLNQPALFASMLALCQVKDKNSDVEKYYDFIKVLFKTQDSWAFVPDFALKLENIAKLDGISSEKFNSCIKDSSLQESILKARLEAAKTLQIESAPTFFIGNEIVSGYSGYGDLKRVIDKKLSALAAIPTSENSISNPKQ